MEYGHTQIVAILVTLINLETGWWGRATSCRATVVARAPPIPG